MSYPKTFRHGVIDGWIAINNATSSESMYPLSWWITQEPAYTYPNGASYVQYTENGVPGQSYYIKNNNQTGLPEDPWLDGNSYIAKQSVYDAAYALFIGTPATVEQARSLKMQELLAQLEIVRSGYVIYDGNTIPSSLIEYQSRFSEYTLSSLKTPPAVPTSYYVKDILGNHLTFDFADLTQLISGLSELHYEARLVYDTHNEAINSLSDIETIMAYVVTTGWPITPFVI